MSRRMNKQDILTGITPHKEMQDEILKAIDEAGPDGLHQDKFDEIFGDYIYEQDEKGDKTMRLKRPIIKCHSYVPKAFILGDLYGGEWARYLHLTQLMCVVGILRKTMDGDRVRYQRNQN